MVKKVGLGTSMIVVSVAWILGGWTSAEQARSAVTQPVGDDVEYEFEGTAMGTIVMVPQLQIPSINRAIAVLDSDKSKDKMEFGVLFIGAPGEMPAKGDRVRLARYGYRERPDRAVRFVVATPVVHKLAFPYIVNP